jgi:hypothetical protein
MRGYSFRAFSPGEGNGSPFTGTGEDGREFTGIRGYDESDGIFVPNPAATKPKVGHWRVSPRGRMKMPPNKHGVTLRNPLMANRVDGDYVREDNERRETKRARKRRFLAELREMGYIE